MIKNCQKCNKEFKNRNPKAKYCSRSCIHLGSKTSIETKAKMSLTRKGRIPYWLKGKTPWNKGKKTPEEVKIKQRKPHKPLSEETKRKMGISRSGEKNPNWRGGITEKNHGERLYLMGTKEYKDWRIGVFQRDDYTCQECGSRGVTLHADHIKPFAYYPELRLVIENGRTLCVPCHRKTDTYGGKNFKHKSESKKKINI